MFKREVAAGDGQQVGGEQFFRQTVLRVRIALGRQAFAAVFRDISFGSADDSQRKRVGNVLYQLGTGNLALYVLFRDRTDLARTI